MWTCHWCTWWWQCYHFMGLVCLQKKNTKNSAIACAGPTLGTYIAYRDGGLLLSLIRKVAVHTSPWWINFVLILIAICQVISMIDCWINLNCGDWCVWGWWELLRSVMMWKMRNFLLLWEKSIFINKNRLMKNNSKGRTTEILWCIVCVPLESNGVNLVSGANFATVFLSYSTQPAFILCVLIISPIQFNYIWHLTVQQHCI